MRKLTRVELQTIIDQQAEQLSRLATQLRRMQSEADQQQRDRKVLMNITRQEAIRIGKTIRVPFH